MAHGRKDLRIDQTCRSRTRRLVNQSDIVDRSMTNPRDSIQDGAQGFKRYFQRIDDPASTILRSQLQKHQFGPIAPLRMKFRIQADACRPFETLEELRHGCFGIDDQWFQWASEFRGA